MKTSMLTVLVLLIAYAAAAQTLVVPDSPDLMIKTRQGDGRTTTATLYLKGARQRRETTVERVLPPYLQADTRARVTWIAITQCDEQRTLRLNPEARTYAYEPIEDPAVRAARYQEIIAHAPATPPEVKGALVTITIDSVDTGERRPFGHYTARHVKTTTTTEPTPGASARPERREQDSWYIDVPSAECDDSEHSVTASFLTIGMVGGRPDNVQIKHRGNARRGYVIEETTRQRTERGEYVTKTELVALSEAPLADALFTVPPEYRAALPDAYGGHDMSKPDTILNRLEQYRDAAVLWANYLLRTRLGISVPGTPGTAY